MLNFDQVLEDFAGHVPASNWPGSDETNTAYDQLPALLLKWQNPRDADAITRVQGEVDDTKIILVGVFFQVANNYLFSSSIFFIKP